MGHPRSGVYRMLLEITLTISAACLPGPGAQLRTSMTTFTTACTARWQIRPGMDSWIVVRPSTLS